ncbi:MAG: hypothetical protein ABW061_21770 [Polyangiaceae bacterium]
MSGVRIKVAVLCTFLAALGCSAPAEPTEALGTTEEEAKIELSPEALSFKYLELDPPFPAGVAAGEKVVFIGDPLEGRVFEYSRQTGRKLGELPQPPSPFVLPFMMKHIAPNKVAIMDAGGFPTPLPLVPANPTIYEYTYTSNGASVKATLTRSIPFSSALVGFAEDIVLLKDGRYLLADAVLGSIWIANKNGTISPGIVPKTFDQADAIPELGFCPTMPTVQVGGVPFLFSDSTVPGISTITERDGIVYFANACKGAVYKVPLASLSDSRKPWQRAADIRLLSPKPASTQVEELLSMIFDPSNPSEHYVYAADAMRLRLIRINTLTGQRQVLGDDHELFNFPSSLAFLPPITQNEIFPQLVVVSNQQQLTPITNDLAPGDVFEFPIIATRVVLKPRF